MRWRSDFKVLKERVQVALCAVPGSSVEHVGSTSVPGLWAKPIIDMTVVLERVSDVKPAIRALVSIGYEHLGDLGVPGRTAFRHADDDPPHNLYAGHRDAASIRNHLALREALRSDPLLTEQYGALKRHIAQEHADDIDEYTAAKTRFITGVLADRGGFSESDLAAIRRANELPGDRRGV
jgi:GrpB-like predicted nucleotidyltransferase (UPF0157 family)